MDTSALGNAYDALVELGRRGEFLDPPPGSWGADEVLAHVVASSRLLAAATAEALAGRIPVLDNRPTQSSPYLAAIAESASTRDELVTTAERAGHEVVSLASQLSDAGAAIAVPTIVLDGGVIRVQRPVVLSELLQPSHVLSHLGQLRELERHDKEGEA